MGRTSLTIAKGGCFAAAALLVSPALADDSRSITLVPNSKWHLDFAQDKCRLVRTFTEGEHQYYLKIEQYGPSSGFGLTIAGPAMQQAAQSRRISIQFGAFAKSADVRPFVGKVDGFGSGLIYSNVTLDPADREGDEAGREDEAINRLPQLDAAKAQGVDRIVLEYGGDRSARLETGDLSGPFAAMNTCTLDLLRDWGLDTEKHRTISRMPFWSNQQAVTREIVRTYPTAALTSGEQAILAMRVLIDAQGQVSQCTLLDATTTDRLKSPACRAMQKAKFEPARDKDGNAISSFYLTRIIYKIGG